MNFDDNYLIKLCGVAFQSAIIFGMFDIIIKRIQEILLL